MATNIVPAFRGRRARYLALSLTLTSTALGACGGGTSPSTTAPASPAKAAVTATDRIVPRGRIRLRAGLLAGAASAGTVASYTPRGRIAGDSGFRPDVDGFAFENYGNDARPVNLRPVNVERIFGRAVCATGTGPTCALIPSATQWMQKENDAMAGGHCMGFSVTALRFFTKDLRPVRYGAGRTIDLPIQGNVDLQSLIAENFAYQSLPAVTDRMVQGPPTTVLQALVRALAARRESYTLGIFKADGTGGHAVTPFAVEDRGRRDARILVYDNNFPGIVRALDVDTKANRWRYVGGSNPSDPAELYAGDARTQSMALLPTSPGGRTPALSVLPGQAAD